MLPKLRRPALSVLLTLCLLTSTGCATTPGDHSAGSVLRQRAESAAQGMVIGAMLGAPAGGLIGSGAGAVILGVYGLATGKVPLGSDVPGPHQRGDEPPAEVLDREIEEALKGGEDLPPSL